MDNGGRLAQLALRCFVVSVFADLHFGDLAERLFLLGRATAADWCLLTGTTEPLLKVDFEKKLKTVGWNFQPQISASGGVCALQTLPALQGSCYLPKLNCSSPGVKHGHRHPKPSLDVLTRRSSPLGSPWLKRELRDSDHKGLGETHLQIVSEVP